MQKWYLEGFLDGGNSIIRASISKSPFQIGRQEGLGLTVPCQSVSRVHAEIIIEGNQLIVRDFGSRNGTFINQQPITGQQALNIGDVLRLADFELRLVQDQDTVEDFGQTIVLSPDSAPHELLNNARLLETLISSKEVKAVFQPIVGKDAKTLMGYEILGRGNHEQLSPSPGLLFEIAENFNQAIRLSEIFRESGIATAAEHPAHRYFLNIHPHELKEQRRLMSSLELLKKTYPELALVLEIHEEAVTDLTTMKQLNRELQDLDIRLAYDDFGAGQGRLMELVEVPPYVLKLDRCLIQNIDQASKNHIKMIKLLTEIAKDVGTLTLAECVETEAEVKTCMKLGIDLYQGYVIEKPLPTPSWHSTPLKHEI